MNSNIQSYVNDSTLAVPHSDPLSLCDLSSTFTVVNPFPNCSSAGSMNSGFNHCFENLAPAISGGISNTNSVVVPPPFRSSCFYGISSEISGAIPAPPNYCTGMTAGSYYDTPAALNVIPDITGQSGISQSHVGTFGNSSVGWSCSNSYEPAYSPVTLSGGSSDVSAASSQGLLQIENLENFMDDSSFLDLASVSGPLAGKQINLPAPALTSGMKDTSVSGGKSAEEMRKIAQIVQDLDQVAQMLENSDAGKAFVAPQVNSGASFSAPTGSATPSRSVETQTMPGSPFVPIPPVQNPPNFMKGSISSNAAALLKAGQTVTYFPGSEVNSARLTSYLHDVARSRCFEKGARAMTRVQTIVQQRLASFYAASSINLLRRRLRDRYQLMAAKSSGHLAEDVADALLGTTEELLDDLDSALLISEELLTSQVRGRWCDPMAWLSEWNVPFENSAGVPEAGYRNGFLSVRPHESYSAHPVGKRFDERSEFAPPGSRVRKLVSAGKGLAILLADYVRIQDLLSTVVLTSLAGLGIKTGSIPRLIAYALFPSFLPSPPLGQTCSFATYIDYEGHRFQLLRYEAIPVLVNNMLSTLRDPGLAAKVTVEIRKELVTQIKFNFRSIASDIRRNRSDTVLDRGLGLTSTDLTLYRNSRDSRNPDRRPTRE